MIWKYLVLNRLAINSWMGYNTYVRKCVCSTSLGHCSRQIKTTNQMQNIRACTGFDGGLEVKKAIRGAGPRINP